MPPALSNSTAEPVVLDRQNTGNETVRYRMGHEPIRTWRLAEQFIGQGQPWQSVIVLDEHSTDQLESPSTATTASTRVQERFAALRDVWKEAWVFSSSLTEMAMSKEYQSIIGLGWDAVPLLLQELRDDPDHWFWALRAIVDDDPVSPEDRGDFDVMRTAWLSWGARQGLVELD